MSLNGNVGASTMNHTASYKSHTNPGMRDLQATPDLEPRNEAFGDEDKLTPKISPPKELELSK